MNPEVSLIGTVLCFSVNARVLDLLFPDEGSGSEHVDPGDKCSEADQCYSGCCLCRIPYGLIKKCECSDNAAAPGFIKGGDICGGEDYFCKGFPKPKCFSGKCTCKRDRDNCRCEPDSPVQGLLGKGGKCDRDRECYSGKCRDHKCK